MLVVSWIRRRRTAEVVAILFGLFHTMSLLESFARDCVDIVIDAHESARFGRI